MAIPYRPGPTSEETIRRHRAERARLARGEGSPLDGAALPPAHDRVEEPELHLPGPEIPEPSASEVEQRRREVAVRHIEAPQWAEDYREHKEGALDRGAARSIGFERGLAQDSGDRMRRNALQRIQEERAKAVAEQQAHYEATKPMPGGRAGSPLRGRRGVADSVPDRYLTPEQRKARDYQLHQPKVPRADGPGGEGYNVWDQTANDGKGGYVPRAPADRPLQHQAGTTLEYRAKMAGIDINAYSEEEMPQLEADLAAFENRHNRMMEDYDVAKVPGGGMRYTPNQRTKDRMESQRGEKWLQDEYARWEKQARGDRNGDGNQDVTFSQFRQAYDEGTGLSHADRVANVRNTYTNQWKAEHGADVRGAIRERADQDNTARRMNTSVANVMFQRDLQNAGTSEDMIRTLIAYHAQNPELGLGNFAAFKQKSQDEADALKVVQQQRAEENRSPVQKEQEDLKKAQRASPESVAIYRSSYKRTMPAGTPADPKREDAYVADKGTTHAQSVWSKVASGNGGTVSAEEQEYFRQWTAAVKNSSEDGDDYENWARRLGADPWNDAARNTWYAMTGEYAKGWGQQAGHSLGLW